MGVATVWFIHLMCFDIQVLIYQVGWPDRYHLACFHRYACQSCKNEPDVAWHCRHVLILPCVSCCDLYSVSRIVHCVFSMYAISYHGVMCCMRGIGAMLNLEWCMGWRITIHGVPRCIFSEMMYGVYGVVWCVWCESLLFDAQVAVL